MDVGVGPRGGGHPEDLAAIRRFCHEAYGYFPSGDNVACFDTHNATNPIFTDTSLSNTADRQWTWLLCNEPFGFWQDGAPAGTPL